MQQTDTAAVVRACFKAWEDGDRDALAALLADGFTFSSPNDDYIDEAEYWATCWPGRDQISSYRFLSLLASGDEAYVHYECELVDGTRFRNVEHFRLDRGRIASVDVYFGREARAG